MNVRRVLLVEDDHLLATGIADAFAQLGVETVGPAGSVKQALELVEHGGRLDAAVLDINLRGDVVYLLPTLFARAGYRLSSRQDTSGRRSPRDIGMWRASGSLSIRPAFCAPCSARAIGSWR